MEQCGEMVSSGHPSGLNKQAKLQLAATNQLLDRRFTFGPAFVDPNNKRGDPSVQAGGLHGTNFVCE